MVDSLSVRRRFAEKQRFFRLLVTSAALDTKFATRTQPVAASSASSQKEASQKPIENNDELADRIKLT